MIYDIDTPYSVSGLRHCAAQAIAPSLNIRRLAALKAMLGWQNAEIAAASGFSRPYVVRALSGDLEASGAFWRRMENALGALVANRASQVFDHVGAEVPTGAPACAGRR